MNTQIGSLEAAIKQRLEADSEFQTSIADLSDEEKVTKISEKSAEVREVVFAEVMADATKHKTAYEGQKTRAEKAERVLKDKGITVEEEPGEGAEHAQAKNDLSTDDLYALMEAKVPREDIEEVKKAAKILNKPIAEALQDEMVQNVLKDRQEKRRVADATGTDKGRPGTKQATPGEILAEAQKGNIPEPGTPEAEALFKARRGIQ